IVEPASAFLMSSLAQLMIAPNSRVAAPTMVTTSLAFADRSKIGPDRTIKYTPAVTMVAAWIRAETGVGPSIASSSQDCSGSWADLPQAPSRSSSPSAVITPWPAFPTCPNTPLNVTEPKVANISMIATDIPRSPTRLATNAFLAATAAAGLYCQKPMSRYEVRPTPSQPTYRTR